MSKERSDLFKKNRKTLLKEHDKCELCGSRRNIEVHHIIPVVCGGDDDFSNLLVVCNGCHSKLTNRSWLTKRGQKTVKRICPKDFYMAINNIIEDGETPDVIDILDIFDSMVFD